MASFNYTGLARIQWGRGLGDTEQLIDFNAATKTLRVFPLECEHYNATDNRAWIEYIGSIDDHPAAHIVFLNC